MTGKFVSVVFILGIALVSPRAILAQTTFGPVCDGVTVTCPPTPSPTEAPPPTDAPPPPELPRAGTTENILSLLGIGSVLVLGGIFSRVSFSESKQ